jgi:shikimate dehydrogenase
VRLAGRAIVIIGAGGAAASAALAASRLKAARVVIANRTRSRATVLARRCGHAFGKTRFEATGLEALGDARLLADTACVINATPMGLVTRGFARLDYRATPQDCFFYDMLYARKPTPFLSGAIRAHRSHADGAGMLIEQGELAFKLFNGVAAPRGVMRDALMDALGRSRHSTGSRPG